ncbi:hypothetical protein HD806DRAFT_524100 [Xylariaceae sp. AK1471]|nr:hypothetical protein HD806DRAFT_524100 [Xylariaceae sp. AK1471]
METSTYTHARSIYGTQSSTSTSRGTEFPEQHPEHADHYDLFLLIQDMLRSDEGAILEFPTGEGDPEGISIGLGAGGFSSVSRKIANRRWGNRSVMAYKRIRPSFDSDGRVDERAALRQVVNELKVLSAESIRSHVNISRLRGVSFETQSHRSDGRLFPALILDPSPLGNLLNFIQDPVRMVDGPYWECCMDVGRGLQALHKSRFIHGDVKCENVLIFPAVNYEGRDFVAKLTDFGCSMILDTVEPNTYTRLRGSTPPYDAPEADGMMHRDHLPFTDIYSYGILVWRVAIDGAEPFNHLRYRHSTPDDGGTRYDHAVIRRDKGNENILNIALNEMLDPALGLSPDTADGFCEVLSIALNSDPTQRDLSRIMEAFERNQLNFQRRTFDLTASSGRFLRESTKHEIEMMRWISQSRYGLAEWNSIPPKAHHLYHIVHKYGTINSDFRGFGLSRLPPQSEGLREFLLAIENVYLSCSRPVPPIETLHPVTSTEFMTNFMDMSNQITQIIKTVVKDAIGVARICLDARSCITALSSALKRYGNICSSMGSLLGSAAGRETSNLSRTQRTTRARHTQGLYDRPGGLAATDMIKMMNERTPSTSPFPVYKASCYLDFYLLSTCRLPFVLQEQLFADISSRARRLMNRAGGRLVAMEEAICYSLGFGIEQDHIRYLSIANECCMMGHRPAQESLQQLYDALGLPLPQEVLSSPWFLRKQEVDLSLSSDVAKTVSSIQSPVHDKGSNHNVAIHDSTDIEGVLHMDLSQVNDRNYDGDTLLITACRARNLPVAKFLIDKGADCSVKNNLGESPIHWVWTFDTNSIPSIVSRMIHRGADPNAVAIESSLLDPHVPYPLVGGTALHRAVAQGNKGAVEELIRNGASVFQGGGPVFFHRGHSSSLDPIQLACIWHEAKILEVLLDSAPFYQMNAETSGGVGLLYFAILCQSTHHRMARHGSNLYFRFQETIDLLMRRGCTNAVDKDGLTALQLAVASDSPEILEYILTIYPFTEDINAIVEGKSALHWAISRGKPAAFELLVRNGADVLQPPTQDQVLDFAIRLVCGNDYFVKRTLALGGRSISQTDKNQALSTALKESQWKLAGFLLENGANINGLTHSPKYMKWKPKHTVFGDVLQSINTGGSIEMLETILNLAAKHNQEPQFIVDSDLRESALHVVASHIFIHEKHEAMRLYSLLLGIFPRKSHLEARNFKGWTPLHMAITVRNVVAVRAFLDAGADVNSMSLVEGSPVGPSAKDILFAQLFCREEYYDIDFDSRSEGDRALERIFKIFNEEPISGIAKRSVTLRAEQRGYMSPRDRKVANFVDVLSFLPQQLPRGAPIMTNPYEALRVGRDKEFWHDFELGPLDVARDIQWTGLEKVRFLRQEGATFLKNVGLLEAYLDE